MDVADPVHAVPEPPPPRLPVGVGGTSPPAADSGLGAASSSGRPGALGGLRSGPERLRTRRGPAVGVGRWRRSVNLALPPTSNTLERASATSGRSASLDPRAAQDQHPATRHHDHRAECAVRPVSTWRRSGRLAHGQAALHFDEKRLGVVLERLGLVPGEPGVAERRSANGTGSRRQVPSNSRSTASSLRALRPVDLDRLDRSRESVATGGTSPAPAPAPGMVMLSVQRTPSHQRGAGGRRPRVRVPTRRGRRSSDGGA